nr:hypothetical protein [Tanacetum cinerariifolium]
MSRSTISFESLDESIESFIAHAIVPHPAPVVDSDSEPFEDPASPVVSDSNSFVASLNSEPFEDHVSPTDPLGDDSIDAFAGTNESPPAQVVHVSPQSPSALSAPIAPYRCRETVQGLRKTVRPQPTLPPSTLALIADWVTTPPALSPPSYSPSPARSRPSRKRSHSSC